MTTIKSLPGSKTESLKRKPQTFYLIAFLLCFTFSGQSIITAQNQPAGEAVQKGQEQTTAQTSETEETPTAIPIADITGKIDRSNNELIEIRKILQPVPAVAGIDSQFSAILPVLNEYKKKYSTTNIDKLPPNRIEDMRNRWLRYKTQLSDWQKVLKNRSEVLDNNKTIIQQMNEIWDLTYNSAVREKAPGELLQRIRSVRQTIREVEKELQNRFNKVLALQGRISKEETYISNVLSQLSEARKKTIRVFTLDSDPIWEAIFSPPKGNTVSTSITETRARSLADFESFIANSKTRLKLHLLLSILILSFFFYFSRRVKKWDRDDESKKVAIQIFSRPFSVSFLIALVLSSWIYPHPPTSVDNTIYFLLIFPILRLLPGLLLRWMRKPLYSLAGIYILHKLYFQIPPFSVLQRLLILAVAFFTLLWIFWIIRPSSPVNNIKGKWIQMLLFVAKVFAFLMMLSIISNIIGNVSLANLLTSATLNAAYVLALLYTSTLILENLWVLLLHSQTAQNLGMVKNNVELLKERGLRLTTIAAIMLWIWAILYLFKIDGFVFGWIRGVLSKQWAFGSMIISLGDVLAFGLTIWISIQLARFIRFILEEDVLPGMKLPRGVPAAISTLANYFILFLGFLIALSVAGIEWSKFAILAGALGVGIGFGLQNLVHNFVSGLILLFERPIQVGDVVEVGTLSGQVKRIGIRSSTIRTWGGAEVIIPNANLISNEVTNWTLSDRLRRVELKLGVAYGTDPNKVIEMLREAITTQPDILDIPEPMILFKGFGESSLNFEVRFWTGDLGNWVSLSSKVLVKIYDMLNEAGIEIPFPQRDLHLRSVDASVEKAIGGGDGKPKKTTKAARPRKTEQK